MIIYLHGTDTYRSSATRTEMKEKFIRDRDPQGMNLVELMIGDVTESIVLEQLYAAPFLAEKRMVILNGLVEHGSKELHALLLDHIATGTLPSDIILLATDGEVKPRATVSKQLQTVLAEQQYSQKFDIPTGKALEQWIAKEVHARGGVMDARAVQSFSQIDHIDMWQRSHILDQLIAYMGGRTITVKELTIFVPLKEEDTMFALIDAAVGGNKQRAFDLLRTQYRSGSDVHHVYAMLLRQYRIMLDIADVLERGAPLDATSLGIHPFVLKKTTPIVRALSFGQIRAQYQALIAMDHAIKTGSHDPVRLMDIYIGTIGRTSST